MQPSRGVFAGALVLSAEAGERSIAKLAFDVSDSDGLRPSEARAANAALVEGNAMSNGLPLFEALADGVERQVVQGLAPRSQSAHAGDSRRTRAYRSRESRAEGMNTVQASVPTRFQADVVIMGGGLAGLTLALQLRQRFTQLDIVVIERMRHPVPEAARQGGRIFRRDRRALFRYGARAQGAPHHAAAEEVRFPVLLLRRRRAGRPGHRARREPLPRHAELSARSRHLRELPRRSRKGERRPFHRRGPHRRLRDVG